jgi:hypothetical protein
MQIEKRQFEDRIDYGYFKGDVFIRHREDGPAIEYANGAKIWCLYGMRHREDGPAIEYADGDKVWFIHGKHHREDGPAIELVNGNKEWYLEGKEIEGKNFEKALKIYKLSKLCK